MKICRIGFIVIVLIFFMGFTLVKADSTYPEPNNLKYINDYTGIIDNDAKAYIVALGKELEDKTSAEEVVVLINSLQGKDIDTYANELFRTWGIGQEGKSNGLLVLIAIKDRKWRVEVGTGLEAAVTDIYSSRVMDSFAKPKFKAGNYSEGIKSAYSLFAAAIAKEYNVTLDKGAKLNYKEGGNLTGNKKAEMVAVFIGLVLILLDFIFNRGRITIFMMNLAFWTGHGGGKGGGGGFGGGSSSGGGSSGDW